MLPPPVASLYATWQPRWLPTGDGGQLRYVILRQSQQPPRGTVLVLPGRREFLEKNLELFADWLTRGFDVISLDWRGQGLSSASSRDRHRGHIAGFGWYLRDLQQFWDQVASHAMAGQRIIFGHSLGGHLALRWLAGRAEPLDGLVLAAPLVGLQPGVRWSVVRPLVRLLVALGFEEKLAWGEGHFNPLYQPFADNPLSGDRDRYAQIAGWHQRIPALSRNGVTFGWLEAASRSLEKMLAPGVLESIRTPALLLSAPQDRLVPHEAIERLAERLPHCQWRALFHGRHDLFNDTDSVRSACWRAVDQFLRRLAGG